MKKFTTFMVAAAFSLGMSGPAFADEGAQTHGMTYGEWSAAWWQWQEANYPSFGFGDDCSLGQSGPVWFLGGTSGGGAVRECDEPLKKNRHLFIPLVNANVFDESSLDIEARRALMDGIFSEDPAGPFSSVACSLHIEVDGDPAVFSTPIVRTQSPPFEYAGDPETIADGFWVMLDPLPSGDHEIHFTGALCDISTGTPIFGVEVTYDVTVP